MIDHIKSKGESLDCHCEPHTSPSHIVHLGHQQRIDVLKTFKLRLINGLKNVTVREERERRERGREKWREGVNFNRSMGN